MDSVAKKYLVEKIQNGGAGVWGEVAMAAHPALSDSDAGSMVDYILSLGRQDIVNNLPTYGKYTFKEHMKKESQGVYVFTASYTDKGGEMIGPLTQQQTLILRKPIISAVNFDDGLRTQSMNVEAGTVPGLDEALALVIGEPGSYYVYEGIDFKGISAVNVTILQHPQYMSGGILELRMDSLGGTIIESLNIEQGLLDLGPSDLKFKVSEFEGMHDLYMLFRSEETKPICAVTDITFLR
jgi:cytochrome c